MEHRYWTYIMSSTSGTLYIGMTSDLELRVRQHKTGTFEGFSKKYHCTRLVYREEYDRVFRAIAREKQLKGWRRSKKIALIETQNPRWQDLAAYMDQEIEAAENFQQQVRTAAAAGSFDSGVRPRSG
ncbi:MAG TPA: GIY-YIG nuclease family protein [Terriglobales bacterium]|nr:GIY-YIG nuclease family protein [Terriglobales bacterium]